MGWPKMREQTPFPRMTETDKSGPTDDVTSGMQGACDGLLTHIFHCAGLHLGLGFSRLACASFFLAPHGSYE